MLINIKSSFFQKIMFSHLDRIKSLEIIKYNKILQQRLNIDIKHYQALSGKYLIYESNGIGKIYDGESNNLLFEGEYLNGKKNGKGKEYNGLGLGVIIFEGEYLNGKRHGKGKECIGNKILFEGEYKNGKRNGKGKEYGFEDELSFFEGEYLNGKRNGKGKFTIKDKFFIEGEFLEDRMIKEKSYDKNGNILSEDNGSNEKRT